jgi:Zn-dependent M16 (insulinase) family peptidase
MAQQVLTSGHRISGFVLETTRVIPELRNTAYVFSHEATGARLLHLHNDDPNNLFSIAFCTPVSDSTGVPHILEHSVLGGSRKFPLKDPFQELLKGSLQTFLNALTYPDKTVYPVSSQVEADFFNLVDVYCDAVFFPLLTENTFRQEGWHFDLENPGAPVGIKGIVYNEMKGVFSNFASHVERKTVSLLFPDTSYFFESGGEPEHITDLTWERFKQFHAQYYHPSNSFIVLYGNIPSEKTLTFLHEQYLSRFKKTSPPANIASQPDWFSPRRAVIDAPAPEKDAGLATIALGNSGIRRIHSRPCSAESSTDILWAWNQARSNAPSSTAGSAKTSTISADSRPNSSTGFLVSVSEKAGPNTSMQSSLLCSKR